MSVIITEDGKYILADISEAGRIVIDNLILEDGRTISFDSPFPFSSDSGIGADSLTSLTVTVLQSDTGSGIEEHLSAATLYAVDAGSGLEAIITHGFFLQSSDSGGGTEAIVARLFSLIDSGVGIETLGSRLLGTADQGTGSDAFSELLATLLKSDSGTGAEALLDHIAAVIRLDSGLGVETSYKLAFEFLLLKLFHDKNINISLTQEAVRS